MGAAIYHLQQEVIVPLREATDPSTPLHMLRLLAALDTARKCALQALSSLAERLRQPQQYQMPQSMSYDSELSSSDQSTIVSPWENDVSNLRTRSSNTGSGILRASQSVLYNPEFSASDGSTIASPPEKHRIPVKARSSSSGSEKFYDLSSKMLPFGRPWRWCEGACRLRANPCLSLFDTSYSWSDEEKRMSCQFCTELHFDFLWEHYSPKTIVNEAWARRALNFMFMSHALTQNHVGTLENQADRHSTDEVTNNAMAVKGDGDDDDVNTEVEEDLKTEEVVWVCHACNMRNPHDSGAGPMSQLEMWEHYLALHESKESIPAKRPTPKLMILREPWEVDDKEMSHRRKQSLWAEC